MDIVIRRAEPADARDIKEVFECEGAYFGTLQLPLPSFEYWEKRVSKLPENSYTYVAVLEDEVVGHLGFFVAHQPRRRHVATLGMAVKDRFTGQGIGSKLLSTAIDLADNWLNLKRIEITVFVDNQPAIELYKKFGFSVEGESEAYAFRVANMFRHITWRELPKMHDKAKQFSPQRARARRAKKRRASVRGVSA